MEDLYSLLGVPRDASAEAIKKAYLQKARIEHPDKNPGDAGAHERFQALGRAYSVLRDAEKRSAYDAAGIVDDGPSTIGEAQWTAFWNDFYTRVTQDRIDAFAAGYRGSEEEAADLRRAYEDAKGDMGGILDRMMCSTEADEPRFREMLQADVAAGKVRRLKAFESEAAAKKQKRQQRAANEAAEAEELAKELGLRGAGGSEDGLLAAIVARQGQRQEALLASLTSKFGGAAQVASPRKGEKKDKGASSKAKKTPSADPLADPAAFEAAQRRMLSAVSKGKQR